MNITTTTIVKGLLELFTKVNSDCMRDGADAVPFSDIDYYAEQIEILFEVTEIRAYELATLLAKVTGANHSCYFCDQDDITSDLMHDPKLDLYYCDSDYCCQEATKMRCEICDEKIDCGDYTETTDTGCVHAYCNDIKKESSMFKMTGFKHVTEAGVKDYLQTMDSEGSIGLLWDISNQRRADILMQTADFDISLYCNLHTNTEEEYDNMLIDLHEELVDARFALEHAFIQNLDEITCPVGKRTFSGIQSVKSEDWNPKVYYPMTKEQFEFADISGEFSRFCMEKTAEGYQVQACIITGESIDKDGNGYTSQTFEWLITGAADFYLCLDMVNVLTMYPNIKVVAQLTK